MRQADHEIEIKLRVDDIASARRRLRAIGARGGARVHEANVLFDTSNQSLRGRGMLLRLRVERPARMGLVLKGCGERRALLDAWFFPVRGRQHAVVTLKAPPADPAMSPSREAKAATAPVGRYKVRREIEFEIPDARAFREVLTALGLAPAFYYEKLRTTYRLRHLRGVEITLDETPVGHFFELEGNPAGIARARRALGYRAEDAILWSYGALYLAYCRERGVSPRDMVFEPRPASRFPRR